MTPLYEPVCVRCAEDGIERHATAERFSDALCADHADSYDEAAHEASLPAHYGGFGARSIHEQSRAVSALKRSQR